MVVFNFCGISKRKKYIVRYFGTICFLLMIVLFDILSNDIYIYLGDMVSLIELINQYLNSNTKV